MQFKVEEQLDMQCGLMAVADKMIRGTASRSAIFGRLLLCFGIALFSAAAAATTTINEQFNLATIDPGDTSRYTITIVNSSLVALTSASVTVELPPQITISNPPNVNNGCGFTSVTAVQGTSVVVLTGGTIPTGTVTGDGQCVFQVDVTSVVPGNWVAMIPANMTPTATQSGYTAKENGSDVFNTTAANATLSVNTLQPPTGSKSFAPSPAIAGDPTTLTITLSNPNGASTMPLTSFTDALPGNMVVANPTGASTSCSGAGAVNGTFTPTPSPADSSLTLTGGTIGKGGTCTISVKVVVPTITGTSQSFVNSLDDGAIGNTRALTSAAFNGSVTVNSPIGVSKSFNPTLVPSGQASLLTIDIINGSTANALPITSFVDDMTGTSITVLTTSSSPVAAPADPTVNCTGSGASNGTLTATGGSSTVSLANAIAGPGGRCRITVYVTSTVDGAHVNNIAADAVQNPGGFHSSATSATLTANAQLTLSKTAAPTSVAPGQSTTFTIVIDNFSGGTVSNVNFSDLLPVASGNQMVLTNSGIPTLDSGCSGGTWTGLTPGDTSTGSSPAAGDAGLQWVGGTIAAGSGASPGVCTITFLASLPATATTGLNFKNSIPIGGVSGTGPTSGVQNINAGAANVATISSGDVSKSFSPATIAQGGVSTLTVTIRNRTLNQLTGVNLTDTLPPGLTLAANPASTNSCSGALQAFPGSNQLVLIGGTVAARPATGVEGTCAFSARVTGTSIAGSPYTNQIDPNSLVTNEGVTNPTAQTAKLAITTGLTGVKSFTPTSVAPGGTARVKITINNSSSGQLTNVSIDDNTFSAGLAVANPANAATSCPGSPPIVANPGATRAQLLGATLAAGGSCDFSFDVVATGAGPWSDTIPAGSITSAEGPTNSSAVTASLSTATAALAINKSFNPVIVTGGVPSLLTIDVINSSGIAINGTGFTDTYPDGIQNYSVPNASTNCTGGTVTAVPGDGMVALVGATLAPNATCQVFVTVTSVKFLNLTNTIPAGAITSSQGYTNALGTSASLSTLQGLGVMKAFAPAYIAPNQTSTITVELVSTFDPNDVTPIDLTGVTFTDSLPTGLVFASPANAATDCASGTVSANTTTQAFTLLSAEIPAGTTCTITIDVTAGATGAYVNNIPQGSVTSDQNVNNQNPATATLNVVNLPTVTKSFSPTPVKIGQHSTLTVTVTNNAGIALSGVSLVDTLPTGLAVFSTPSAGTSCPGGVVTANAGESTIALSGANVAANGSCTFHADVVASDSGSFTNTIGPDALVSDQGLTNPGPGNATLDVFAPPTVSKSFNPASIAPNGTSTLTISLSNSNTTALSLSAALVDALPGNVFVAPGPIVTQTCPGAVTAPAGGISITYANGANIPAGGCTISVDVTSAVGPAGYINTIAAGALQTSGGNNADPAVATLGVGQAAAPTVSKSFSPATIAAGGTSSLTIAIANPNAAPITLTAPFVDTLPANVLVAAAPNIGGSCGAANIQAPANGSTVTLANATQVATGGCTIIVDVTSATGGSYTNTIDIGDLQTDAGSNGQPAIGSLLVTTTAPPTVLKSYSTTTINPGGLTRLTITLGNSNLSTLKLTSDFVDNLPGNVAVAATPNVGGTCTIANVATTSGSITYASGSSIPSGGCTIQVDVTSGVSGGPYVNTVAAGSLTTDGGNNGAPATANLFVNPPQPPSISKSFSPATIGTGGLSTLTLSLGNGNAVATTLSADFVDNLPANLLIAAPPNVHTSSGCTALKVVAIAGGTSVTYQTGGVIPAGGGCTITVNVTSTVVAGYTNSIAVNALQTTVGGNTVGTSATLQVLPLPTVFKAFSPISILAGASSTLTITLGNPNPSAITLSANLVDTLPGGLVLATPATISGSCNAANVIAVSGGTSLTYKSGAGIPAGGCTIAVPVTSVTGGSYVNTIPAGALQTNIGNNPGPATATLTVLGPPTVTKSFVPPSISPGGQSTLIIRLGNANTVPATLTATLLDTLPAGLTTTAAPPTGSCDLTKVTVTANSVSYLAGAIIPVGGCTISVGVTAKITRAYTNIIPAGSLQTDAGNQPTAATARVSVQAAGVPTLSQWALGMLLVLLMLVTARATRAGSARPRD